MYRPILFALWFLAIGSVPAFAAGDLEAQVREIERLGTTAHWRESNARIENLASQLDSLSPEQRSRIEFVRLRNLGLTENQSAALAGLAELLHQDMPPALRLRVYLTAISIAANIDDWPRAFTWLRESLSHLSETPSEAASLFGIASYVHTLVDEIDKARDFGQRALQAAESGNDRRTICTALSYLALTEDHAGNFSESETLRHRQIEACTEADDLVFTANGKYGVGKMSARQGRHAEALAWTRQALAEFEAAGFAVGAWSAKLVLAESLIELNRDLDQAEILLVDTLHHYLGQNSHAAIAETEHLFARLAEQRGDPTRTIVHLKQAMSASKEAERDARERRLAYLQVEFDTRLKEQQIALLEAEKELAAVRFTATRRWQLLLATGVVALLAVAALLSGLLRRSARERGRYRWLSERDGLTRLYNYQQVRKLGEDAFDRAQRIGRPFTAVVADIDLFKQINDRHGHAAGDEVLRALGAWMNDELADKGLLGRSGGEEFTLLLDTDIDGAEALVQRLRDRIEPVSCYGQTVRFSLSFGLCQADSQTLSLEQLLRKADLALYEAKHSGRDRVVKAGCESVGSKPDGGLVVVGCGIQLGRHITERSLSEIQAAEVVFCLADPFALGMIRGIRPDAVNLGLHYAVGKDRRQTYREIDAAIMAEVRAGKRVCTVFYGHPGVFADVPHRVIEKARAEGIPARMEPGISAEACLYADLGIDPGKRGVQSMEATHFLVYDRLIDPCGLVLLWQVALSGDLSCTRFHAEREGVQALVDKLLRWYPPEHEVILYEAARLPIETFRADRLALRDLPGATYQEYTTLVIPPLGDLREDTRTAGHPALAPGLEASRT